MNANDEAEADNLVRMLQEAADKLAEHCDSVQIMATRRKGSAVDQRCAAGTGNIYARFGSVRDWIIFMEEQSRIEARNSEQD